MTELMERQRKSFLLGDLRLWIPRTFTGFM